MRARSAGVALVCVLSMLSSLHASPLPGGIQADVDYQMAELPTHEMQSDGPVSQELVSGDLAEQVPDESLQKGPKVNGGFALNIVPTRKSETSLMANADCAGGHYVNGKCVRSFPRISRKATVEDNMLSPEHDTALSYEADIHSFVREHFGQNVMEENAQDEYHATIPGIDLITHVMNKGNEDENWVTSATPSDMDDGFGDMESGIGAIDMNVLRRGHTEQHETLDAGASSEPNLSNAAPTSPVPASASVGGSSSGSNSASSGSSSSATPTVSSSESSASGSSASAPIISSDSSVTLPPVAGGMLPAAPESPRLTSEQGEEIAEQGAQVVEVDDEVGDVESTLPSPNVDAEADLPPTPTPTPTPNYEEIARILAERQAAQAKIDTCIALLSSEHIACIAEDRESMALSALAQVQAPVTTYDPSDVRGNFQNLLIDCTSKATASLTSAMASTASAELRSERSVYTRALIKYASAMSCVDAADFPACVPTEVSATLQRPPSEWSCF